MPDSYRYAREDYDRADELDRMLLDQFVDEYAPADLDELPLSAQSECEPRPEKPACPRCRYTHSPDEGCECRSAGCGERTDLEGFCSQCGTVFDPVEAWRREYAAWRAAQRMREAA